MPKPNAIIHAPVGPADQSETLCGLIVRENSKIRVTRFHSEWVWDYKFAEQCGNCARVAIARPLP